jgi:sarcosine oxidase subunit alpha
MMSDGIMTRLPSQSGEWLDRTREIAFTFEGRRHTGFAGDTIASALAADGVSLLSRSFKYRRPRGALTMAGQDANTLVQLPGEPNILADMRGIEPGMAVLGQNYDGSLEADRGRWVEWLGRFMPVGFYYKAFYKPFGSWRRWEPFIRRKAGLGVIDTEAPHPYHDKAYGFCDVAVIGGGPAGLAAAAQAAEDGAEVLLVEENPRLGGSLTYARFDAEGARAAEVAKDLIGAVETSERIEVMTGAVCNGWFADHYLPVIRGNRLYKIRAKRVVVATGSMEQPIVFRGNDTPGVMMGSAAQRLIRRHAVRPGRRAVVATANGDGYGVALDLLEAGVAVLAVLDLRPEPAACPRAEAVRGRGVPVLPNHTVWEAWAGPDHRVAGLRIAEIAGRGEARPGARFNCDLLCMSVGYTPAAHVACHAGAKLRYDPALGMLVLADLPDGIHAAGSAAGAFDLDAAIAQGRQAGWQSTREKVMSVRAIDSLHRRTDWFVSDAGSGPMPIVPGELGAEGVSHPWPIFPHPKGKDFVDFDEDLQVKDIRNAVAEGYEDIELLKRFSTAGMGPSQGRHTAANLARLAAEAAGRDLAEMGATTVRPPYTAESFGILAGRGFEPARRSAMHHRHLEAGAQMMLAGLWQRPAFYGPESAREVSIEAEAMAVRTGVGLIDVSTLGGLEIRGPDAAEFMNRMYTFAYAKQAVGRARYVLMCSPSGAVIDDGVACRFHDDHFYVTATTGGVDAVYRQMLWFNAQWRLDVDVTNVTAAYAGVNIAGPLSRAVLAPLCSDLDLSAEAFPYMALREGRVAGIPARLLRVGFVGELGYEIHVPASYGEALWDALMEAGAAAGIRPFGVEAQRLLRLEKGHVIIGQDTDSETTPHEADMVWALSRKKPFYVGERALRIQAARPLKRKLVGFVMTSPREPAPAESHLVVRGGTITGRVTSAAYSPILGRVIGLAYVAPDQAEPGTRFSIRYHGGRMVMAEVVPLPHYDPDNARQEM